jgi:penicillin-binding protein 2
MLPGVSHRWHDWTFRNAIGGGHGLIDLKRAIYQSCNTFFYNLGNLMGISMIHDFMSNFGFGQNFALDIPYARTGVLPSREWKEESRGEPWYQGDTIISSIGQGYMWTTPLQLATAISIIANKGKVIPPRMLKAIDDQSYIHEFEESEPDVILSDPDYWDYIEDGMAMVVHRAYTKEFRDNGTAFAAIAQADPDMPYKMAGKSGTAQLVGIAQNITRSVDIELEDLQKDNGLFVSYAPVQNPLVKPKIVVAVFVENGESGGSVAGPIAKQIIDAYLLDILQIDVETLSASEEPLETLITVTE